MLTSFKMTVRSTFLGLVLAVFFSPFVMSESSSLRNLETGLGDLIYEISSSIVTVQADFTVPGSVSRFGGHETVQSLITSGVIVDSSGLIAVSAVSVVGCQSLQVIAVNNRTFPARIIGVDYQTGLAVISTSVPVGPPVNMTDRYTCAGQMVLAVGNAFGLRVSPTLGFCAGFREDGRIQFNCSITSGTIGGGLFGLDGRMVGIISSGLGGDAQPNIGLAIPSADLKEAVQFLANEGDRPAGFLGMSTREFDIMPGIPVKRGGYVTATGNSSSIIHRGLLITSVISGGPASNAGLRPGDLIYNIDQENITSSELLKSRILTTFPGTELDVSFMRSSQVFTLPVRVGASKSASLLSSRTLATETDPAELNRDSLLGEIKRLQRLLLKWEQNLRGR